MLVSQVEPGQHLTQHFTHRSPLQKRQVPGPYGSPVGGVWNVSSWTRSRELHVEGIWVHVEPLTDEKKTEGKTIPGEKHVFF